MNAPERIPAVEVFDGLAADQYHADPAVSNSMLSSMARSPAHFWALHRAPSRPAATEPTAAMRAGTLLHALLLEPSTVPALYAVRPAGLDGRTRAGKEWLEAHAGRVVLTAEEWATAEAQRDALLAVQEIAHALADGIAERSIWWTDPATGLRCKARPDWRRPLGDGRVLLLDLKTTADPSPSAFAKSAHTYGYHRQAAHYEAGAEAAGDVVAGFLFAVVSNAYPFIAVPYVLDPASAELGRQQRDRLLRRVAECEATGRWPAFGDGVQSLSLPAWAFNE